MLVLCPEGESLPVLERLLEPWSGALPDGVSLERCSGDLAERVRRLRAERDNVALGVVAEDEAAALLALEAGADESLPSERLDARSALAFIDRVRVRARLRDVQAGTSAASAHHDKLMALGTLVAGVAHEVNNPLTALLLSVEALRLSVPNAEPEDTASRAPSPLLAAELLDDIEVSARAIAAVVRDLKVFSRPDSDDAPSELVDLRELVEQVLRVVGRQLRLHARVELDFEPSLPAVAIPAARVAQVFTNILVNAAQAVSQVPRAGHQVRISARSDAEMVAISISDTGPGIPAEVVSRIFEPFFTTKERGAGTGLGLAISRSILRRIGGDLLVESVHGQGATFIVLIPRPDAEELAAASQRRRSVPVTMPAAARKPRVLVVEPDERVLRAIARALESSCDVVGASDAREAIELLSSGTVAEAVLADASPPDCAGLELESWLTAEQHPLRAKLVLMVAEENDAPEGLGRSSAPVLFKPIGRNALVRALSGRVSLAE